MKTTMMLVGLALGIFALAAQVRCQLPVPPLQRGYTLRGDRSSFVTVEVFYDLLCPDSKANWPLLNKLVTSETYTAPQLGVVMNVFPLPYHHHATFVATGFRAFMARAKFIGLPKRLECTSKLFMDQDQFKTQAVDLSESELGARIGSFFKSQCDVDVADAFSNATTHEQFRAQVVMDWKYAAARTVCGTPVFIVNGVMDNAVGDFVTLDQWEDYIRRLLGGIPQVNIEAAHTSR